ncbi:hypothetical protein SRHO_G00051990 [Serrasalmus rhombeus]
MRKKGMYSSSKLLTEFHSESELSVSAGGRETSPLRAYAFKTTWTHLRSQLRKVQSDTYVKQISLEKTDQAWRTAALLPSAGFRQKKSYEWPHVIPQTLF